MAAFVIIVYSSYITNDVITRDQWRFLSIIEEYKEGKFGFASIWESHSQQRTPLYKVWFLINAILFNLNTQIDIYIGIFSTVILTTTIFKDSGAADSWITDKTAILFILTLLSTAFTLNQWSQFSYGLNGFQDLFGSLILILLFFHIRKALISKFSTINCIKLACFIVLYSLLIGEVRTPAVAMSIVIGCLYAYKHNPRSRTIIKYTLVICSALFASQMTYWLVPPDIGITENKGATLDHLQMLKGAYLYAISLSASTVFPTSVLKNQVSIIELQIIGGAVVTVTMSAIYLGIKSGVYNKNLIPLMMILFTIFYTAELIVGRFSQGFGIYNAMAPRYVNETIFGLVGVIWTYRLVFIHYKKSNPIFLLNYIKVVFSLLLVAQLYSAVIMIGHAKYQKKSADVYYRLLIQHRDSGKVSSQLPKWACNYQQICETGIRILKENRLNIMKNSESSNIL